MAAVAGRREHEPFMLDGEAHLSTTSEGELRIWWFGFSKTQSVKDTRAHALDHTLNEQQKMAHKTGLRLSSRWSTFAGLCAAHVKIVGAFQSSFGAFE